MKSLFRPRDPRLYQIAVLGMLVTYGIVVLEFGIHWYNAVAIILTAQFAQFTCMRLVGMTGFDPLSAAITSLSLTLLLRTDVIGIAILAACIAISSKFLLRVRGKHIFNPAKHECRVCDEKGDRGFRAPRTRQNDKSKARQCEGADRGIAPLT